MSTYSGAQFIQPIKNIMGEVIKRDIQPTPEEVETARREGKHQIILKQEPFTLRMAIKDAMFMDMAIYGPSGQTIERDPHEDKKYEIFNITRSIMSADAESQVKLESEDKVIILARCKRRYNAEVYGFIHDVIEDNNKDFKIVNSSKPKKS